jgi:hypothetical protein
MKEYKFKREPFKLCEMATAGKINDLTIAVYTDHKPAHFHVLKKDCFEVRISLKTLKVISYKWQIDNKEISTKELKKVADWTKQSNKKKPKNTNGEILEILWDSLN